MTIDGSNLDTATSATFGSGGSVPVVLDSDGSLIAETPLLDPGDYDITVTNPDGTSAPAAGVTYSVPCMSGPPLEAPVEPVDAGSVGGIKDSGGGGLVTPPTGGTGGPGAGLVTTPSASATPGLGTSPTPPTPGLSTVAGPGAGGLSTLAPGTAAGTPTPAGIPSPAPLPVPGQASPQSLPAPPERSSPPKGGIQHTMVANSPVTSSHHRLDPIQQAATTVVLMAGCALVARAQARSRHHNRPRPRPSYARAI